MENREMVEQLCSVMIRNATESRMATNDRGFSGAAYYSQREINSALEQSCKKGMGRIEQEIFSEIHDLTFHATRGAILNLDQSRFVNKYKSIESTFDD